MKPTKKRQRLAQRIESWQKTFTSVQGTRFARAYTKPGSTKK